jgi:hypothetical protein
LVWALLNEQSSYQLINEKKELRKLEKCFELKVSMLLTTSGNISNIKYHEEKENIQ